VKFHVLGFDVRTPRHPEGAEAEGMRPPSLLRSAVSRVLSVDEGIWPRIAPDRYEQLVDAISREEDRRRFEIQNGIVRLLSGVPRGWLAEPIGPWTPDALICLTTTSRQLEEIESAYGEAWSTFRWCDIDESDIVASGWRCLGFDVADFTGGISALSGTRYTPRDRAQLEDFERVLNEFHLFPDPDSAGSYRALRDDQVTGHAPLDVFGIWSHPANQLDGP